MVNNEKLIGTLPQGIDVIEKVSHKAVLLYPGSTVQQSITTDACLAKE